MKFFSCKFHVSRLQRKVLFKKIYFKLFIEVNVFASCPVCSLDAQEYRDGQTWTQISDPCSTCTCQVKHDRLHVSCFFSLRLLIEVSQAGEVQCASAECAKLPCMHQVTVPGSCCPRCRGNQSECDLQSVAAFPLHLELCT